MLYRRELIKALTGVAFSGSLTGCGSLVDSRSAPDQRDDWVMANAIREQIRQPVFPNRDFEIENFGAVANGKTDCTAAFRDAIAACHAAGGGRVVAGQGVYRSGAIHLRSNVNLHIAEGATLSFIPDPQHYLPAVFTRWEGMEMMGYSPLIYAYGQHNIAVTGKGRLDGSADDNTWWPWKGAREDAHWNLIPGQDQKAARTQLQDDVVNGVPPRQRHYAENAFLRPAFIQPYACRNLLIEGVTLVNSPFWLIHPVLCESVTIRAVTCRSHGPNNDGCDPESCKNVLIENCLFDTGDDCIALKSGRNEDGRRVGVAIENVVIADCKMLDGHGGMVLGSEISGGARNIFLERCHMSSENLDRAIRIKTNSRRGGVIEKIRVRDVHVGRVKDAIVVNFYYEEGDAGNFDPVVRDVEIRNLICDSADRAFYIRGFARAPVRDFRVIDSVFHSVKHKSVIENAEGLQLLNVAGGEPAE